MQKALSVLSTPAPLLSVQSQLLSMTLTLCTQFSPKWPCFQQALQWEVGRLKDQGTQSDTCAVLGGGS